MPRCNANVGTSQRSKILSLSEDTLSLPHALYTTFLAHSHQIQKAALLAFMRGDFWEKGLNWQPECLTIRVLFDGQKTSKMEGLVSLAQTV